MTNSTELLILAWSMRSPVPRRNPLGPHIDHARINNAAERKAFVGDGLADNWTVWKKYFSHYTPVLDFVHAAMAGRAFAVGWNIYCRWAQAVWSGRLEEVLVELHSRQEELGLPTDDDPEHSPRCIVAV